MRKAFFSEFTKQDAWLLYDDVGYGIIDQSHPRVINVGIAEQAMVGMAAGMASQGARVYCYFIAPHIIRAWEFVRNLVVPKGRDVVLVGVGRNGDYAELGFTHDIDCLAMRRLCEAINLPYVAPCTPEELEAAMKRGGPLFLHLTKKSV
jgi:transketolase